MTILTFLRNCRTKLAYTRFFVVLVNSVPEAVFSLPKPALYVLSMYKVSKQITTKNQCPLVNFLYLETFWESKAPDFYQGFLNDLTISEVLRRHSITFRRSEDFRVPVPRCASANTTSLQVLSPSEMSEFRASTYEFKCIFFFIHCLKSPFFDKAGQLRL